uniref:Putative secreted protein n=1 Tax=Rhipicephalus microplus TaxID=6941 RepID=A0A6G5A1L3_RHIMP
MHGFAFGILFFLWLCRFLVLRVSSGAVLFTRICTRQSALLSPLHLRDQEKDRHEKTPLHTHGRAPLPLPLVPCCISSERKPQEAHTHSHRESLIFLSAVQ